MGLTCVSDWISGMTNGWLGHNAVQLDIWKCI